MATYPISCSCGSTLQVSGTEAGTTQTCICGSAVQVPSLAKLKAAVGEATVSADLKLQHLISENALPLESDCVQCHRPTMHTVRIQVECERPENKGGVALWRVVILWLICGWFQAILYQVSKRRDADVTHGRNVAFDLPVRVCEECESSAADIDLLRATPLYSALLDKYPHADVRRLR